LVRWQVLGRAAGLIVVHEVSRRTVLFQKIFRARPAHGWTCCRPPGSGPDLRSSSPPATERDLTSNLRFSRRRPGSGSAGRSRARPGDSQRAWAKITHRIGIGIAIEIAIDPWPDADGVSSCGPTAIRYRLRVAGPGRCRGGGHLAKEICGGFCYNLILILCQRS